MVKKTLSPLQRAVVWFATGFGLGYSPLASGTVGCLWGIPIAWGLAMTGGVGIQILLAVFLAGLAIPVCHAGEAAFGKKDDGRIVADEFLTFPLCMIGLPFVPWVVLMAFVTNRICDIIKPPPARGLQALRGGLGIVIDDVISSCYSLAINHLLYYVVTHVAVR